MEPSAITRIGVTIGPGSFMGQRVGVAFAKGLAMGTGADTVPFTTLEALAETAGTPSAVLIDARRGQVYAQRFGAGGVAVDEAALLSLEEAEQWLDNAPEPAVGSGLTALGRDNPGATVPSVEALLALTERRKAGPLRTLYLRAPDAKAPTKQPL